MSTTPRTDELRNRASRGNLDESDLFDAAEQLETELSSVQLELGATKGELNETKSQSTSFLKAWVEASQQLAESQAREAQLREALERISSAKFSWDGDCGVVSMAQEALNSFTAKHPTL